MNKIIHAFDIGDLGTMDATEIAAKINQKSLSPQEVVACTIERAKQVNPKLNAIASECFDSISENLPAYEEGCFAGVPTFIKDLVHVKGFSTRHGSESVREKIQKKSEKNAAQILSTGCIALGKSTTSEFGFLPTVETRLHGATQNPLQLGYSTGGSSGGAAALVAAGVVPFAHASDGGGSIRIPASCCGLIGLKPSRGRDMESPTSIMPIDIVCQGVLTRTVRDSAHYYAAAEQYLVDAKLPPIGLVDQPIKERLRIGVFTNTPTGISSHIDVDQAVQGAGQFCANLGHHVELIANPFSQETKIDFLAYWSMLACMVYKFGKLTYGFDFDKSKLEPFTIEMAKVCPKVFRDTLRSIKRLKQFTNYYNGLFEQYDVLLSPVLSQPVPKIGYFGPENNFFSTIEKLSQYVNFTTFQNVTGAPAISLPMGQCSNGMPIGVQFAANIGNDRRLLELAFEIEAHGGLIDWTKIMRETVQPLAF